MVIRRRRKHKFKAKSHHAIRPPCPNCRHSPRINRANPSSHNHHGRGSFCRYHFRQPVGRRYCNANGTPKRRIKR